MFFFPISISISISISAGRNLRAGSSGFDGPVGRRGHRLLRRDADAAGELRVCAGPGREQEVARRNRVGRRLHQRLRVSYVRADDD